MFYERADENRGTGRIPADGTAAGRRSPGETRRPLSAQGRERGRAMLAGRKTFRVALMLAPLAAFGAGRGFAQGPLIPETIGRDPGSVRSTLGPTPGAGVNPFGSTPGTDPEFLGGRP